MAVFCPFGLSQASLAGKLCRDCQQIRGSLHGSAHVASSPYAVQSSFGWKRLHRRTGVQCSGGENGSLSSDLSDQIAANKPGGNPSPAPGVRYRSRLEQLYFNDSAVPEEPIAAPRPVTSMPSRAIGAHPPCARCRSVGAVECATCAATGLYVDAIMESQGIIVKVRCMGCGGSGSVLCMSCGGRGHV